MNNRKTFIVIVLGIMTLISFIIYQLRPRLSSSAHNNEPIKKEVSIFVQSGDEYVSQDTIPKGRYNLNKDKTYCVAGGKVSNYDSEKGTVKYILSTTDSCFVYFDLAPEKIQIAVNTNGTANSAPSNLLGYKTAVTCDSGSAVWDYRYQRLNIDVDDTSCTLSYTTNNDSKTLLKTVVENANSSYNYNGYRYKGANPNNYIWFNNEMWRIIGSVPTCTTSSCGTGTNLVKIIKNTPLGGYAYSSLTSSSTHQSYGSSNLKTILNTHYYASSISNLNGTSDAACTLNDYTFSCDFTGKGILADSYYGKMIKSVYWNTGAIKEYDISANGAYNYEKQIQTDSAYVGLMNYSDFLYASGYPGDIYLTTDILYNDWLYGSGSELTLSIYYNSSYSSYMPLLVSETTSLSDNNYYYYVHSVRPVVYLASSVYIISGTGTVNDPYIIGM